jgi:hypothetical protein
MSILKKPPAWESRLIATFVSFALCLPHSHSIKQEMNPFSDEAAFQAVTRKSLYIGSFYPL